MTYSKNPKSHNLKREALSFYRGQAKDFVSKFHQTFKEQKILT